MNRGRCKVYNLATTLGGPIGAAVAGVVAAISKEYPPSTVAERSERIAWLAVLLLVATCALQQLGCGATYGLTADVRSLRSTCEGPPRRDAVRLRTRVAESFTGSLAQRDARQLVSSSIRWLQYFEARGWSDSAGDWGCATETGVLDGEVGEPLDDLTALDERCSPVHETLEAVSKTREMIAAQPSSASLLAPLDQFVADRSPTYDEAACGRERTEDEEAIRALLRHLLMFETAPPPTVAVHGVDPRCVAIPTVGGATEVEPPNQLREDLFNVCGGPVLFFALTDDSADLDEDHYPPWLRSLVEEREYPRPVKLIDSSYGILYVMGRRGDAWSVIDELVYERGDCMNLRRG